ncbi:MAG: tail fiber domain-containing protein [Bdellovibrionales bacterium]
MFRNKKNGFTIVELALSALIVGLLTVVIATFAVDSTKLSQSAESQNAAEELYREFIHFISNTNNCTSALRTTVTAAFPVNLNFLLNPDGLRQFEVDRIVGQNSVRFSAIRLTDFRPLDAAAPSERGFLQIQLDLSRWDSQMGRDVTVQRNSIVLVTRNITDQAITKCGSSPFDLWQYSQSDPNDIYSPKAVGIGVNMPTAPLDVGRLPVLFGTSGGPQLILETNNTDKIFRTTNNADLLFGTSVRPTFGVSSGRLGIHLAPPYSAVADLRQDVDDQSALHLNHGDSNRWSFIVSGNDLRLRHNYLVADGPTNLVIYPQVLVGDDVSSAGTNNFFVDGTAGGTTGWIVASDLRLKKDIRQIQDPLKIIKKLRPVSYRYYSDPKNIIRYGFIAQEVEKILPEIVDQNGSYKKIQIDALTAVMIDAIKELHQAQRKVESEFDEFISSLCLESPNHEACHE